MAANINFLILFIIFGAFLCIDFISGNISLSEVMFNPNEEIEWLEIYADENFNITGLKIKDNYQSDNIECCNESCNKSVQANNYFLIFAKNKILTPNYDYCETIPCFFYCVDDSSIGNGLGNTGDIILVYFNEDLLINFSYNVSTKKGNSLSFLDNKWLETIPSPWEENKQDISEEKLEPNIQNQTQTANSSNESLESVIEPNIDFEIIFTENDFFVNQRYENFFKVLNKNYPKYKERSNLTLSYNVSKKGISFYEVLNISFISYTTKTSNFIFNESGIYTICGEIFVNDLINDFGNGVIANDLNLSNNKICQDVYVKEYKDILCNISFDIFVEKEIYDLGDQVSFYFVVSNETFPFEIEYWIENNYEIIKDKQITKNTNKKSFPLNKEGLYFIKGNLKTQCNNTNSENKSRSFYVNKIYEKESKLDIVDFNLKEDYIQIKIYIYKGNTTKKAVYISFDDKKTTFYAEEKYTEYLFTFPIYYEKCGNKTIVLEGLDQELRKSIIIECKKDNKEDNAESNKENNNVENKNNKEENKENLISWASEKITPTQTEKQTEKSSAKQYHLIDFTKNITDGFYSIIKINNNDNQSHKYSISFYIYNSSKKYSDILAKEVIIGGNSTEEVFLENFINNEVNGIIRMKIKILRDDRKTPYEFTEQVFAFFKIPENTTKDEPIIENKTTIETYEKKILKDSEEITLDILSDKNITNEFEIDEYMQGSNNLQNKPLNNPISDEIQNNTSKEALNKITGLVFFNKEKNITYVLFFAVLLGAFYFFSKLSARLFR